METRSAMERDELRAALDALAAEVAPLDDDALTTVQAVGRRRRRRRAGIATSAASAALLIALFTGIAIAGHRHEPTIVATGPSSTVDGSTSTPTTVDTSTSTPATTTEVCTEADIAASGPLPMPTPTRITTTRLYEHDEERL